MNQPNTDTTGVTRSDVEELQLEIVGMLPTLLELIPLVAALADSHQPGVGFMSFDARQTENAMIRKERRLQVEAEILGRPLGHGATAAPGNLAAVSAHVEVWAAAHHAVDQLVKHLSETTVTGLHLVIPDDGGTVVGLLRMIRPLVWETTDHTVLRSLRDDLRHVQTTAERVVDGPARVYYPDAVCPHCGRPSLAADFERGVIESVTCDKDQNTGERHPCTCPDPLCACKSRPVAHRHTWYRKHGNKPDGLLTLTGWIRRNKNADQKGPGQ